jgi:hypothetical protein
MNVKKFCPTLCDFSETGEYRCITSDDLTDEQFEILEELSELQHAQFAKLSELFDVVFIIRQYPTNYTEVLTWDSNFFVSQIYCKPKGIMTLKHIKAISTLCAEYTDIVENDYLEMLFNN